MIVKVQVAIGGNSPADNEGLIYSEDRKVYLIAPLPESVIKIVVDNGYKAYFYAKMEKGDLVLCRQADPQPW